jgi:hypothetical protein
MGIIYLKLVKREGVKFISKHGTFEEDTNDPIKIQGAQEMLARSVHRFDNYGPIRKTDNGFSKIVKHCINVKCLFKLFIFSVLCTLPIIRYHRAMASLIFNILFYLKFKKMFF